MKKLLTLLILLSLVLTSISLAGYLDDWTDDQLCGWMENPSPPEYIVDEAIKRNLDCIPESAAKKPVIIFIIVDFPAPFGPKKPTNSPFFIEKLTS